MPRHVKKVALTCNIIDGAPPPLRFLPRRIHVLNSGDSPNHTQTLVWYQSTPYSCSLTISLSHIHAPALETFSPALLCDGDQPLNLSNGHAHTAQKHKHVFEHSATDHRKFSPRFCDDTLSSASFFPQLNWDANHEKEIGFR